MDSEALITTQAWLRQQPFALPTPTVTLVIIQTSYNGHHHRLHYHPHYQHHYHHCSKLHAVLSVRACVQAEMVLKADPGIPGQNPRVWAYRNTIKALNWWLRLSVPHSH